MQKLFLIFRLILIINFIKKCSQKINGRETTKLEGVYIINSLLNNYYFSFKNNKLKLSKIERNFKINKVKPNIYFIESIDYKKK